VPGPMPKAPAAQWVKASTPSWGRGTALGVPVEPEVVRMKPVPGGTACLRSSPGCEARAVTVSPARVYRQPASAVTAAR
jgi:hypothetical protein